MLKEIWLVKKQLKSTQKMLEDLIKSMAERKTTMLFKKIDFDADKLT